MLVYQRVCCDARHASQATQWVFHVVSLQREDGFVWKKKNSPKSSGWSAVLYSDGYNLYYLGGYIYIYYMGMGQNPGT